MGQDTKERLSAVEKALEDFIRQTNRGFAKLQDAQVDLKLSMEDFKEEMRESRESFEKEMRESRERSAKEMQEFKNEMNRKWGELANRLGNLAEDFVAPNIPFIAQKYFHCPAEPDMISMRVMRKHSRDKSKIREFDIVAVYDDKVILNETKSTARQSYIDQFAEFLPEFYDYYPEYKGRELVPIFATLYINAQLVDYATRQGIYVLAVKEDTMDLYNYQQVTEGKNK